MNETIAAHVFARKLENDTYVCRCGHECADHVIWALHRRRESKDPNGFGRVRPGEGVALPCHLTYCTKQAGTCWRIRGLTNSLGRPMNLYELTKDDAVALARDGGLASMSARRHAR